MISAWYLNGSSDHFVFFLATKAAKGLERLERNPISAKLTKWLDRHIHYPDEAHGIKNGLAVDLHLYFSNQLPTLPSAARLLDTSV